MLLLPPPVARLLLVAPQRLRRRLRRRRKLRKAKKEAPPNEKPAVVKTHLRDMIIVPEMIGSVVGIYNGKVRLPRSSRWVEEG